MSIQNRLNKLREQREILDKEIADLEDKMVELKQGDVIRYVYPDCIENHWLIADGGMMVMIKGNDVGCTIEAPASVPVMCDSFGYEYAYAIKSEK